MTVHTICDTCGMEYVGPGVTIGNRIYCCAGCARGGPCTCGAGATVVAGDAVVAGGGGTVVTGGGTVVTSGGTVIAGDDDVVIVE